MNELLDVFDLDTAQWWCQEWPPRLYFHLKHGKAYMVEIMLGTRPYSFLVCAPDPLTLIGIGAPNMVPQSQRGTVVSAKYETLHESIKDSPGCAGFLMMTSDGRECLRWVK